MRQFNYGFVGEYGQSQPVWVSARDAQGGDDALDAGVVWSTAIADKTIGSGERFKKIDGDIEIALCLQSNICCINSSGTGANNGQTKLVHGV